MSKANEQINKSTSTKTYKESVSPEARSNYYDRNKDYKGSRVIDGDQELVDYQKNSTVRIWYNDQNASYDYHRHNAVEIIMPVENYYEVECPSGIYHLEPGDIIIIPPNEMHKLDTPPEGKRFVFMLDISFMTSLEAFTAISPLFASFIHITPATHNNIYNEVYQLLVQMRNEYFQGTPFHEMTIHAHILELFVLLGQDHLSKVDMYSGLNSLMQKEYMQRFNNVLSYIDSHFCEELSLEDVADFSGFSKFHFTRLFKKYTNSTFYDYLIYRRVQEAERLLAEADLTITDVALRSGFSSISTFNRTFKQKKNCTPREYRSMCRSHHSSPMSTL